MIHLIKNNKFKIIGLLIFLLGVLFTFLSRKNGVEIYHLLIMIVGLSTMLIDDDNDDNGDAWIASSYFYLIN